MLYKDDGYYQTAAVERLKTKVHNWQEVRDEVPGVRADGSSEAPDALALSSYIEASAREHRLVRGWLIAQAFHVLIGHLAHGGAREGAAPREPMQKMTGLLTGPSVMIWLTKTIAASVRERLADRRLARVWATLLDDDYEGAVQTWESLKNVHDLLVANRSFHHGMPSGLMWKLAGAARPTGGGEQVDSPELASTLASKIEGAAPKPGLVVELSRKEWESLGIEELHSDDYIKSGDVYFRPAGLSSQQAEDLRARGLSADPAWTVTSEGTTLISRIGRLFSHERILGGLHAMLLAPPVAQALEQQKGQGAEDVLIIPHQDLFAVPWSALRNASGRFLIQDYVVRVAPSLRVAHQTATALAAAPEGDAGRRHAVVVGNPDLCNEQLELPYAEEEAEEVAEALFEQGFGEVNKLCGKEASKKAVLESLGALGLKWERLGEEKPQQGRELSNPRLAEELQSKTDFTLEEWKSFGITDLGNGSFIRAGGLYFKPALGGTRTTSEGAQDGAASRPSPRARWLHLACHADLVLNALLLARKKPQRAFCKHCGFAFRIPEAAQDSTSEVWDLSMGEVFAMVRLAPSATVILSACNSGRGTIMSEGVVGLSRSFLAAGAGAVVSSLWCIRDESTQILMWHFYEKLRQGHAVPKAMQLAVIELIEGGEWAAPVHWSGFMVVGASTYLRKPAAEEED